MLKVALILLELQKLFGLGPLIWQAQVNAKGK